MLVAAAMLVEVEIAAAELEMVVVVVVEVEMTTNFTRVCATGLLIHSRHLRRRIQKSPLDG